MSLISGYLNQTARYYASGEFYNGPALATLTLNEIDLGVDFLVKVVRSWNSGDRYADLVGTLDGDPVSERLSFSGMYGTLEKISSKWFDTLTAVTTNMGGDAEQYLRVVGVDSGEHELGAWVDFPCRWEDKTSHYLKVTDDHHSQLIALSDAKVFCEIPLADGHLVRRVVGGVSGTIYEVKKVRPAEGLEGNEEYRLLLLGGVGE
jgi:hypothetical protein